MNQNKPERLHQFDGLRPLLFSIAYRMTGRVMDAEDILQEAYLRWERAAETEVRDAKSFLTAVVTRLCIDQLRSAKTQREMYIGPWLPEPLVMTDDTQKNAPVEAAELAESLSFAFLVLLEQLSPVERAVFLLREIFDYNYAEIARIVGKSSANCRQLVKRAHDHLRAHRPGIPTSRETEAAVLGNFASAMLNGDVPGLLALLNPDVTCISDGGGKVVAARRPIYGADKVARFLFGIYRLMPEDLTIEVATVNGCPAFVGFRGGKPYMVMAFELEGDKICNVYNVRNPDKMRHLEVGS